VYSNKNEFMKLAVVGSRNFEDLEKLSLELDRLHAKNTITLIISGGAVGADSLAEVWAKSKSIPVQIFKPDWKKHGKSAGFIRNRDIINSCDSCIAFWDGVSKGTLNSINLAKTRKIRLEIMLYKKIGNTHIYS
jgi:hypothetical protein